MFNIIKSKYYFKNLKNSFIQWGNGLYLHHFFIGELFECVSEEIFQLFERKEN